MKLVRRSLLPLAVCVLALGLASQAVASTAASTRGQGYAAAGQSFSCLGTVMAVDPVAGTITLTVRHATVALQGSVGQSLKLTVTSGSALSTYVKGVKTAIALAGVPKGDLIAACGTIDATDPAVLLYAVGTAVVWQPAADYRFQCQGTVSSVDLQADSLAVTVGRGSWGLCGSLGKNVTIDLAAKARIFVATHRRWSSATAADITAGDVVTIVGCADRSDPGAPVFTASFVLVRHVAPVSALTWFAGVGRVSSVDQKAGIVTVEVKRGTRAVRAAIGGELMLLTTPSSVMRTLSNGVVTAVALTDVQAGESIVVTGAIDHSNAATPVYDIGHAFVWQPATSS
jgi:hypothetical protein